MKKLTYIFALCATIGFTAVSCGDGAETENTHQADAGTIYACPMHPEVTSDGPADCHKCGMPLEKYTKEEHQEMME